MLSYQSAVYCVCPQKSPALGWALPPSKKRLSVWKSFLFPLFTPAGTVYLKHKRLLCTLPFASAWLGCGTLSEGIICMRWARMENEPDTCTARCVVQVSGETRFIGHGREEFGVLCFSLRWMLHAWYKTVLLRETDGRLGVNYIYSLWNYFHINISSPDELGDISKMAIMNIVVWLETDLITDSLQWHMHLP